MYQNTLPLPDPIHTTVQRPYCTVPCHIVPYRTAPYHTVVYCTMQHHAIPYRTRQKHLSTPHSPQRGRRPEGCRLHQNPPARHPRRRRPGDRPPPPLPSALSLIAPQPRPSPPPPPDCRRRLRLRHETSPPFQPSTPSTTPLVLTGSTEPPPPVAVSAVAACR